MPRRSPRAQITYPNRSPEPAAHIGQLRWLPVEIIGQHVSGEWVARFVHEDVRAFADGAWILISPEVFA
jgi:hypothetical protein